jgi:hypothetical protein
MSLDPTWLFVSLIPGGIGLVFFVYGKTQQRWAHMVAGLSLMVYPYFTSDLVSLIAVGAVIALALWGGGAPGLVTSANARCRSSFKQESA